MNIEDLRRIAYNLSSSQGFYGRILEDLENMDDDELKELNNEIENANLKTDLDLILWLEQ